MIKAYIRDTIIGGLDIAIVLEGDGQARRILHLDGDHPTWADLPEAANTEPTLRLDDQMARALLDALTRHYQGAEDTRALRRDYDAERARVDKLIDAAIRTTPAP